MLLSSSGSRSPTIVGYSFKGVTVDVQRARLHVEGQEIAVGALALKLLRIVCEANSALVDRQTLFAQIWPRQTISDEALTKLIGRTRELLGPYGAALVTVRGQGVRLDAEISPQFELQYPESASSAARSNNLIDFPSATVPEVVPQKRWLSLVGGAVGMSALLVIGALLWWHKSDEMVGPAYALRASDLQASRAQTPELIQAAFTARGNGELSHARAMMRSAHESDPTSPVPAMMLAWWEADVSPNSAPRWIDAARARLHDDSSAYLRLMIDYFDARSSGHDVRGPINALLDLRPQAWALQFARAHDQLGNHEFAGALKSLQQIPRDTPDADQLADILADRVSLGDAVAASQVTPAITRDAVLNACLQGRFAYSRGALDEAVAAFDRCRETALVRRDYLHARDAAAYAALAAVEANTADAVQRVESASRLCHEQQVQSCENELLALRAFLEARAGHTDTAAATVAEAWQHNRWDWAKPPLVLVALENDLPAPADPAEVARGVPRDTVFGGVSDLLLAWRAFAAGDRADARGLLERAREHGVAQTYHAEDAMLLAARLGESAATCRVDPPYPNLLRLSACVALQGLKKP